MRVNQSKFAEIIGKSGEYVRLLVDQGLPAERSGKRGAQVFIDTVLAIAWLLDRERKAAQPPDGGTLDSETKRLRAAQADLAELQAKERRGELMDAETVRQVVSTAGVIFATQTDALPARMAAELAAISDPALIRHRLREEIMRIRTAVSEAFEALAAKS